MTPNRTFAGTAWPSARSRAQARYRARPSCDDSLTSARRAAGSAGSRKRVVPRCRGLAVSRLERRQVVAEQQVVDVVGGVVLVRLVGRLGNDGSRGTQA